MTVLAQIAVCGFALIALLAYFLIVFHIVRFVFLFDLFGWPSPDPTASPTTLLPGLLH